MEAGIIDKLLENVHRRNTHDLLWKTGQTISFHNSLLSPFQHTLHAALLHLGCSLAIEKISLKRLAAPRIQAPTFATRNILVTLGVN